MKIEDAKVGMKVKIHPSGPVLTIKSICGRLVKLVLVEDTGDERGWGLCPVSLVDEVK